MWRPKRATQISFITSSLCFGVLTTRLWFQWVEVIAVIFIVLAIAVLRVRLGLLLIVVFAFGIWRADTTDVYRSDLGRHVGQKVELVGVAADDAGINERDQAAFILNTKRLNGSAVHGSVRIYTASYKELQRGYQVGAVGKMKPARGSVPLQMSFAQVAVLSTHQSRLEHMRQRFFSAMRMAMPEPMSGFGLGLLVGARSLIDKQLQDTLTAVGLSHLTAVSGYNLTIIIRAVRKGLSRLSYFSATALSMWLILGFLLVTGFSASIVRAALVATIGLIITYYGYTPKPLTLIALPAFITVAWKPDYLVRDLGWQLSFLAFIGIMVIAPVLERRFVRHPNTIKLLAIESLAAQIVTAPLILGVFGNFSVVSPISNLVILPLVPLAMLLGFLVGLIGLGLPLLAAWLALPAVGLLGLMIGIIQWFGDWPHANLNLSATTGMVLLMYGVISIGCLVLWRSARHYTDQSDHAEDRFIR